MRHAILKRVNKFVKENNLGANIRAGYSGAYLYFRAEGFVRRSRFVLHRDQYKHYKKCFSEYLFRALEILQ